MLKNTDLVDFYSRWWRPRQIYSFAVVAKPDLKLLALPPCGEWDLDLNMSGGRRRAYLGERTHSSPAK